MNNKANIQLKKIVQTVDSEALSVNQLSRIVVIALLCAVVILVRPFFLSVETAYGTPLGLSTYAAVNITHQQDDGASSDAAKVEATATDRIDGEQPTEPSVVDNGEASPPPAVDNTDAPESPVMDNSEASPPPAVDSTDAPELPVVDNGEASPPPAVDNTDAPESPVVDNGEASSPPAVDNTNAYPPPSATDSTEAETAVVTSAPTIVDESDSATPLPIVEPTDPPATDSMLVEDANTPVAVPVATNAGPAVTPMVPEPTPSPLSVQPAQPEVGTTVELGAPDVAPVAPAPVTPSMESVVIPPTSTAPMFTATAPPTLQAIPTSIPTVSNPVSNSVASNHQGSSWRPPTVDPYCPNPMPVRPEVPPFRPMPLPTATTQNPAESPTQVPPTATVVIALPTATATPTSTVIPATLVPTSEPTDIPTAIPAVTEPAATIISPTITISPTLSPTLAVEPTATAEPTASLDSESELDETVLPPSALRFEGEWVQRIIGDRLSSTLYAYADDMLYRSDNGGRTWMIVSATPQVSDFVMNAGEPTVLYSTSYRSCREASRLDRLGPIYKSIDGGLSWAELPTTTDLRPLFSYAFNSDIVVATDCSGFFVSTNGGETWTPRPEAGSDSIWQTYVPDVVLPLYNRDEQDGSLSGVEAIYAGGVSRDGSSVVAYSSDLGRTWTQVTPDIYPAPWGVSALTVDWLNPGLIWFADATGIWFSDDNGLAWEYSQFGLDDILGIPTATAASPFTSLTVHPSNQIFLGTKSGLYAKTIDGSQWTKTSGAAFDTSEILDVFYIESVSQLLYVSTTEGVHVVRIGQ